LKLPITDSSGLAGSEAVEFYESWRYGGARNRTRHQGVIAGAEGPLLRELLREGRYHAAARQYWPLRGSLLALASGTMKSPKNPRIRCFDLGSIFLALTYLATPGVSVARNSRNPFFFRVPFDVCVDARAFRELLFVSWQPKRNRNCV
jgi:hypothetical protein